MHQKSMFLYESQFMQDSVPFHRVSKWDRNTFYYSSLSEASIVLSIGHGGRRCPYYVSPNATTFSDVMQEIGFLHKHYRNGPIGAIFQDTDII